MRGDERRQEGLVMFTSLEDRIPADHPLRPLRQMVDQALAEMSPLFAALYHERGRHSIPPEYLLRAQLGQILFGISSERRLCEHLEYNLLLRWFVGLPLSEAVWDHSTFTKNRDRLLTAPVAEAFFEHIRGQAEARTLLSREHFSVDGTLLEAAASLKSFRPRGASEDDGPGAGPTGGGRNPEVDFHGERRRNDTHCSRTDPDARLARKGAGKEAKLAYAGHVLIENRHGLIVGCALTRATGTAEVEAALALMGVERERRRGRMTVGADAGYNTRGFVATARTLGVTPHVARKHRASAIDGRTTSWDGYQVSQRRRKIVEECFGWMKTAGLLRKLRHRGHERVRAMFIFTSATFNLVRLRNLTAEPSLR
jgi:transposase